MTDVTSTTFAQYLDDLNDERARTRVFQVEWYQRGMVIDKLQHRIASARRVAKARYHVIRTLRTELAALKAETPREPKPRSMADAAEMLWVVLANVNGGDWTKQTPDWQKAAVRANNYIAGLRAESSAPSATPLEALVMPDLTETDMAAMEQIVSDRAASSPLAVPPETSK